jgi:hypothetical protein
VVYLGSGDHVSSAILAAETEDDGSTWQFRQVAPRDKQNVRPFVPYNLDGAHPTLPVVWMHGYYHFERNNDGYQTGVVGSLPADVQARSAVDLGNTTQTISSGTKTKLAWGRLLENWAGILDESNDEFVVPVDGLYYVALYVLYESLSAAATVLMPHRGQRPERAVHGSDRRVV